MITIKPGVTPRNLTIAAACANAAGELGLTVTVTAGTNGTHMAGSKHYTGDALDIRSKNLTVTQARAFLTNVRKRLGVGYDAFLEAPGTPNEHFHIEYDPPTPP